MTAAARAFPAILAAALALAPMAELALAQSRPPQKQRSTAPAPKPQAAAGENVPNAVQGFSKNRHEPIQIDAGSLEVQDKDKIATFRGKVHVVQGDTDLRCNVLIVYYEQTDGDTSGAAKTAIAGPSETQRIRRLEAKGNVVVTQKDQVATGDNGEFDMRKNLITLRGNVVVSQANNVLRGDRLVVDMTTGISHVESDKGRVQGLFLPSKREDDSRKHDSGTLPKLH
jgi:lipopolysaccharide export system protein LptA